MDVMDVADLSMQMSQAKLMDQVGTKVLDMALESFEGQGSEVVKLMEESVQETIQPEGLGQHMDISV